MKLRFGLSGPLTLAIAHTTLPAQTPAAPRVAINDNRTPAGALRDGVLAIRLEIREGEWHPDRDSDPGVVIRAFGEEGMAPAVPGPLLRMPEGTLVHATITNRLGVQSARPPADAELAGAFVIDPAGASGPPRDRVMVLAEWNRDARPSGVVQRTDLLRFTINGKAWPNTERLAYDLGDTVRFRVVNLSETPHPMHLHGFYFDVESRGDGTRDTRYDPAGPPHWVVTERMAPGSTISLAWVPERPGTGSFTATTTSTCFVTRRSTARASCPSTGSIQRTMRSR